MRMTINTDIISIHGVDRAKDRCNMKNVRMAERNAVRAMQRGKRAEDYTSWEREYLGKEALGDCMAVAYNDYCYIFNPDGVCVTMYHLPAWFGKKKRFDGKERIRNYKRYCRNQFVTYEEV